MGNKYVIIHGHFYQPPRENPWTDVIESQPSAAPLHNWNERVYDECYRPNAYSRILDANGAIIDIHNNFLNLSFNFGPTLFSWLEQHHVVTARRIIEADQISRKALDGYGNAIAQVYNHIIMPLASRRDQMTQIRWGKHYFRERFKRDPEGMWLAETAVNMETVQCLIEENIRFIVLSPNQAEAFKPLEGNGGWASAYNGLDTMRAYRLFPSDRSGNRLQGHIDIFFFDVALSREVGFGGLLRDAHILANRINALFSERDEDQAVVLATDGETFGHHKPFGDMCLAYFFKMIAPSMGIVPVNFGFFLAKNPPRCEVLLKDSFGEGTAWSCAHGMGRWTRDCGCSTGGKPGWKQEWRAPLRTALRQVKKKVDTEFERTLVSLGIADPWALRDAYIAVMDDPSAVRFKELLEQYTSGMPQLQEKSVSLRRLLEAQKYMLYAFTSCGWFFADISGIETLQNMTYALRALQLGLPPQERMTALYAMTALLSQAKSNLRNFNGAMLFEKKILPFYDHEKILAFTGAVQKVVSIEKADKLRLFRYTINLRRLCAIESGLLSYHGFEVGLDNQFTGEQSRWAVLISHREWAEMRGWVVRAEDFGKRLNRFVEPEDWMKNPRVTALSLNDCFQSSRENMTDYIHQIFFKDTYAKFLSWTQKNEQELDFLSRLGFTLPAYCTVPLTFVYNQQWNLLIRRLEHRGDEEEVATKLRDLFALQSQFKIIFDLKESAGLLERIIIKEISALSVRLDSTTCERVGFLLSVVDRYKIPLAKNKIEDTFHPLLAGPIRDLSHEVRHLSALEKPDAEQERLLVYKHGLVTAVLGFARRMNFNADEFTM